MLTAAHALSRTREFPEAELRARAQRLRLVLSDVDGVLTDAGVYYSASGEELKRFSVRDGMGVELLRDGGVATALLTREDSAVVRARASKLGIPCYGSARDKLGTIRELLPRLGLSLPEIAFIGDDVNDVPLLELLSDHGLTAAPADAAGAARRRALFTTVAPGGHGAFREFADYLILLRGKEQT